MISFCGATTGIAGYLSLDTGYLPFTASWKNLPLDGDTRHLSNIVLGIRDTLYTLPSPNVSVRVRLGRL